MLPKRNPGLEFANAISLPTPLSAKFTNATAFIVTNGNAFSVTNATLSALGVLGLMFSY